MNKTNNIAYLQNNNGQLVFNNTIEIKNVS